MLTPIERLKFELFAEGMQISSAARERLASLSGQQALTLADYATTSGIPLRLPQDIWVNVPVADHNPGLVGNPRHVLDWQGNGFTVCSGDLVAPAMPSPVPEYCGRRNSAGEPHSWYGVTHTDRVRISPVGGCAGSCAFCDSPRTSEYRQKDVNLLCECIREALQDPVLPARHVLISGGVPRRDGYGYLRDVYSSVLEAFPDTPIDIMMLPIPELLDVSDLKRRGLRELSVNLELFNEEARSRLIPEKAAIPREDWFAFIEGVAETPGISIRSLLVVGLESVEDTLRGVEALARRGCEPVLSPFRPAPQTPLECTPAPSADTMVDVFLRAREVAARYGAKLGPKCLPCQHNTLSLPDGSEYYTA